MVGTALALLLTACGTAAPDTEEVALPEGFGTQTAEKSPETPPTEEPTGEDPPTEDPTSEDPTAEDPTGEEPTSEDPTEETSGTESPTAGGDSTAPSADVCFNPEHEDWAPGSPGEATWGEAVEITADEEAINVSVAEPTIRETQFAMDDEPAYVWEAEVTATSAGDYGFTSITDYVLLDPSNNECMIGWADTTLWGLMVYEEGDQETGKAAFLVPTQDVADYTLVFVGEINREAQQIWKP